MKFKILENVNKSLENLDGRRILFKFVFVILNTWIALINYGYMMRVWFNFSKVVRGSYSEDPTWQKLYYINKASESRWEIFMIIYLIFCFSGLAVVLLARKNMLNKIILITIPSISLWFIFNMYYSWSSFPYNSHFMLVFERCFEFIFNSPWPRD